MRNDHLDAQLAARLVRRALSIAGGAERLVDILGVQSGELARWLAGQAFPPEPVFEQVLAFILDARETASPSPGDASTGKARVLIGERPEGIAAIASVLGDEFEVVAVHALTDALDIVQAGAVLKSGRVDAIVCGLHFEGSQMLRFLECVKAYPATRDIPFIGCRATPTQLGDRALGAMREACEALGAIAYIDLPESQTRRGTEAAAVEFREAVRAAIRLPHAGAGLRVLVVDDNPDAAHMLSALLRIAGYEVIKATHAGDALRYAREQTPAVAVIDIAMPGISGYDLAGKLRAEAWGEEITLIALTGRGLPEDAARARAAGFDRHFTKPVVLEQLLAAFPRSKPS